MSEELKYAKDYWQYIREILSKYKDRKDNDGKRIIKSNSSQSGKD
jgi:hypothetical protein